HRDRWPLAALPDRDRRGGELALRGATPEPVGAGPRRTGWPAATDRRGRRGAGRGAIRRADAAGGRLRRRLRSRDAAADRLGARRSVRREPRGRPRRAATPLAPRRAPP